ncbi:hypothetical protein ACNAUL_02935 [Raoultella ornithinolytica]|uniref:hypothetical protein n=1 Tax=Raoultella ornithinolytica TaxID=54291 RepID=UPI0012C5A3E9|nr:hypothetical protein [Raoultella ornithinolytica]KAB8133966.1 hypothetical protein FNH10_14100 [Raoultella ornithinolytica]
MTTLPSGGVLSLWAAASWSREQTLFSHHKYSRFDGDSHSPPGRPRPAACIAGMDDPQHARHFP